MVSVEKIQKSYGKKTVLRDITMQAGPGECIGILGGNGSGKSTLLQILAGVTRPDGGKFLYEGKSLFGDSARRAAAVGYVPQGTPLIEELSAKDNLRLWYTPEAMEASLSGGVLALLGIGDFLKTRVLHMSGGMKKRLAIGCAVAHNPPILLLDEPSAALDLPCKERIAEYLLAYKAAGGTVLLATHDLQEVELCDSLYILKDGYQQAFEYDGDVQKLTGSLKA
ncbi:MAG: ABC transporter ATP-binding protein [Ruminococcaceae bacterium]|nr:ABC transporter ATP-binding protein [Oscillospiraceae bacterium]